MAKDKGQNSGSQLADALAAAGVTAAAGDANVTEVIDKMVDEQAKELAEIQAVRAQYGEPVISMLDGNVKAGFNGSKSLPVLEVTVPLPFVGIKIVATMYASLVTDAEGETVDVTPYINAKSVKFMDAEGKRRMHAIIGNAVLNWPGYDKMYAAAGRALKGSREKATGAMAAAFEVPTLRKRLTTTTVVSQ